MINKNRNRFKTVGHGKGVIYQGLHNVIWLGFGQVEAYLSQIFYEKIKNCYMVGLNSRRKIASLASCQ